MGNQKSYIIQYTKGADKFFVKNEDYRIKYEEAIKTLLTSDHPEAVDLKKIKGTKSDYYRIRLGDVRVIYAIIQNRIIVITTLLAGHRGDVYKKL